MGRCATLPSAVPALPDAGNVVRLDFGHTRSADPHLGNRTFWKFSGSGPSISNMNDLAGFAEGFWSSYLKGLAPADVSLVEIVATDLTSPTASRGQWSGSVAGTRSGGSLTINDCTLLNFEILRRYRGGKPRIYAPWGTATDLANDSTFNSTFITAVETGWADFRGGFIGQGFGSCAITEQVNVSYYEGFASVENPVTKRYRNIPTPRTTPQIDQVAAFTCNPFVGSQRRRIRA